jgi:hypothetical protein
MADSFWGAALSREDGSPADGIHLLWTAPPAAGYSVGGYDIQRRVRSGKPRVQCYTLTSDDLARLHTDFTITTPVALLSVRETPCPTAPGRLPDDPHGDKGTLRCVDFLALDGKIADSVDGLQLAAFDAQGTRRPHVAVRSSGGFRGVDCANHLEISLPAATVRVVLTLVHFAQPGRVAARAADGHVVASASMSAAVDTAETITLAAPGIARIVIIAPADETLVTRLCYEITIVSPVSTHPPTWSAAASTSAPVAVLAARAPNCLRYRALFDGPRQLVEVVVQVPAALIIAMREGKAVDSRFVSNANSSQGALFTGRGVDEVLVYVGQRIAGLTICADIRESPEQEAAEWKSVPYIAKGIQLPVQGVNPALSGPPAELALAESRLVAGEAIDASGFADVARTMNDTVAVGGASPMSFTRLERERLEDPFIEVRPWPYALSLTAVAEWRRALGFGYLDKGTGLVSGTHYDYRITGHFHRRDLEETLLAFHTIPLGTTLPATFHLGTMRFSSAQPRTVEMHPPAPLAGLRITGRKGIRVAPSLMLGFDAPVTRVALELEPALASTLQYRAMTTDFIVGLSGTTFAGPIAAVGRVTLDFAEPVDTITLLGVGFLYGLRVLSASSSNPDNVLDRSIIIADVSYVPTVPPAPPIAIGTTNLQQPILAGDPNVTTQHPPQPLGFTVQWLPPAPAGVSTPLWPPDLGTTPPLDTSFQIERRRVDTGEPFVEIDKQPIPTVFFGNRGSRSDPPALELGIDLLAVFPENVTPTPPIDPFVSVDDILRSAAKADGPPPGSLHQYRLFSVDAIGRRSPAAATGSVVRLEKRIAPPRPGGPAAAPPPNVVRAAGVRARVLQRTDPDIAPDDVALLGSSENAIVLEWGWGADERARDPFATEFRVYWHPLPPDVVHGTLVAPATLVGGFHVMACTLDQPLAADAMKGSYLRAPDYPFKVASHTAGTNITVRLEPSILQPGTVPDAATFEFTPVLTGAELRPSAWPERSAVVPIEAGAPSPFIFRDRLTLDASHPRARAWVGVSSADGQSYIPDELPAAVLNGGRAGNESSIAAVVAEARYLGRPTFVVPPPLPAVPEDVSPEPVGPTVSMTRDLVALLPSATIPPGHLVVVEHLQVGVLAAAMSRRTDGTIGVVFPDRTTTSFTLPNPADQAALLAAIATGEPAQIENRFLMELVLLFPAQFEPLWQRAVPSPVAFGLVTDVLPSKAERWLHRVRLVDAAEHISEGAAIVPRLTRVASTRVPSAPEIAMDNSATDSLSVVARARQAFDLEWLVLFSLVVPDPSPVDERLRERAQLLRVPDRRDLYPNDGIRLRLADGTLLSPVAAVNVPAAGIVELPDVRVTATLTPGFGKRTTVWAVTMTRDGIPSRVTGPVTAHTGPVPLVPPALVVAASGGMDTATWSASSAIVEVSLERSADGGATWTRVSPWMPRTATSVAIPGAGTRAYRLVVRDASGQTTAGSPVTPP